MSIQEALADIRRKAPLRLDPAWTGVPLIAPHQAKISAWFTVQAALNVAPFFTLSIALAAYAKASGAENLIARAFTGRPAIMIVVASLMGALSPFCSCGG